MNPHDEAHLFDGEEENGPTENELALEQHETRFPSHEIVVAEWDDDTHWFCEHCPAASEMEDE